jgi:hypothetical protein
MQGSRRMLFRAVVLFKKPAQLEGLRSKLSQLRFEAYSIFLTLGRHFYSLSGSPIRLRTAPSVLNGLENVQRISFKGN